MGLDGIRFRPATPRDTTVVAELIAAGFATYVDFAGADWRPRSSLQEEAEVHTRLSRGDVHARIALAADGMAAGFTGWMPAASRVGAAERLAGRAHLWTLFVATGWWGSGLASALLGWSVDGMHASGFDSAQLWTPAGNARARRFYEREGWEGTDRRQPSPELGLELVLYERALG